MQERGGGRGFARGFGVLGRAVLSTGRRRGRNVATVGGGAGFSPLPARPANARRRGGSRWR